jgi:peptide chain release factor 3
VGKRKSFDKGVLQLSDEGAIQVLKLYERDSDLIFAAVGQLQFEVMQYRLRDEYGVETVLTPLKYSCSAWVIGDLKELEQSSNSVLVLDRQQRPMLLFTSQWEKQYCIKQNPKLQFVDVLV